MKISQYDCVRLKDGREGAVIETFENATSFMVEVCDNEGKTIEMPIVSIGEIEKITYKYSQNN